MTSHASGIVLVCGMRLIVTRRTLRNIPMLVGMTFDAGHFRMSAGIFFDFLRLHLVAGLAVLDHFVQLNAEYRRMNIGMASRTVGKFSLVDGGMTGSAGRKKRAAINARLIGVENFMAFPAGDLMRAAPVPDVGENRIMALGTFNRGQLPDFQIVNLRPLLLARHFCSRKKACHQEQHPDDKSRQSLCLHCPSLILFYRFHPRSGCELSHQRVGVFVTSHAFRILCMKFEIVRLPVTHAAVEYGSVTLFMTIDASQVFVFGAGSFKFDAFGRMASGAEITGRIIGVHDLFRNVGLMAPYAIRIFHGPGMGFVAVGTQSRFRMSRMTFGAIHVRMRGGSALHLLSRLRVAGKTDGFRRLPAAHRRIGRAVGVVASGALTYGIMGGILTRMALFAFGHHAGIGRMFLVAIRAFKLLMSPSLFIQYADGIVVARAAQAGRHGPIINQGFGSMRFVAQPAVGGSHIVAVGLMTIHAGSGLRVLGMTFLAVHIGMRGGMGLHLLLGLGMTGNAGRFGRIDLAEIRFQGGVRFMAIQAFIHGIMRRFLRRVAIGTRKDGCLSDGRMLRVTVQTADFCLVRCAPGIDFVRLRRMAFDAVTVGQRRRIAVTRPRAECNPGTNQDADTKHSFHSCPQPQI